MSAIAFFFVVQYMRPLVAIVQANLKLHLGEIIRDLRALRAAIAALGGEPDPLRSPLQGSAGKILASLGI